MVEIGDDTRLLLSDVVGKSSPRPFLTSLSVHPNPSFQEVVWRVAVDQASPITFETFDVLGRRVHGPEDMVLKPGVREIRWKGLRDVGVRPGVYFLSARGHGTRISSKVVLVE